MAYWNVLGHISKGRPHPYIMIFYILHYIRIFLWPLNILCPWSANLGINHSVFFTEGCKCLFYCQMKSICSENPPPPQNQETSHYKLNQWDKYQSVWWYSAYSTSCRIFLPWYWPHYSLFSNIIVWKVFFFFDCFFVLALEAIFLLFPSSSLPLDAVAPYSTIYVAYESGNQV